MSRARWAMPSMLGLCAAIALTGCAGGPDVVRVVDGRIVGGAYVEPDAYASFLRGAIEEERGDLRAALVAYVQTAESDSEDPEVWTRIGEVRCKLGAGGADAVIAKALAIDPDYAPAWEARARCVARTDPAGGAARVEDATRRAVLADPRAEVPQIALARIDDTRVPGAARDRLLALTLVHRGSAAAWDALAAWGRTHDDPMLMARALGEAVRLSPERRRGTAERAIALAGEGELVAARAVAAAAIDADGPSIAAGAARLAIDEAIAAGDTERARLRAARGHIGLDEAAGRALLLGAPEIARALAAPLAAADPSAAGARMVLAAAAAASHDAPSLARAFDGARGAGAPVPFVALAPLLALVADAAGADVARRWAAELALAPIPANDALVARAAADLAARGAIDDARLPMDARIEVAARRRVAPPDPHPEDTDARHRLLALALLRPTAPETLALARRLTAASARDGLVAAALVRIALARGTSIDARDTGRLVDVDPQDAIVASAALDAARKRGDERTIRPARARLTALARTAAERDQARE